MENSTQNLGICHLKQCTCFLFASLKAKRYFLSYFLDYNNSRVIISKKKFFLTVRQLLELQNIKSMFFNRFSLSTPWNQDTVIGYIIELIFQLLNSEGYFLFNGAILLLFISMCFHHQAFYKMFKFYVHQLNERNEDRDDREYLADLIRFHISIKQ